MRIGGFFAVAFALSIPTAMLADPLPRPIDPSPSTDRPPAVIVSFIVRVDGTADLSTLRIVESSGFPSLDEKASDEVSGLRFVPETEDGEPVEVEHKLRIVFGKSRPRHGMTMETAVVAAPPDNIVLASEPPCDGLPVLTQEGPRTLSGFTIMGPQGELRSAKNALVGSGVPEALIKASRNYDRLTVELKSNIKPSKMMAVYHNIEDGTTQGRATIIPLLLPIDTLIEKGCVAETIRYQPMPQPSAAMPLNAP